MAALGRLSVAHRTDHGRGGVDTKSAQPRANRPSNDQPRRAEQPARLRNDHTRRKAVDQTQAPVEAPDPDVS